MSLIVQALDSDPALAARVSVLGSVPGHVRLDGDRADHPWSFVAWRPRWVLEARGDDLLWWRDGVVEAVSGDALSALQSGLDAWALDPMVDDGQGENRGGIPGCPFLGGAIGFLSYDFGLRLDRLPVDPGWDPCGLPELRFAWHDTLLVHHADGRAWLVVATAPGEDAGVLPARLADALDVLETAATAPSASALRARANPTWTMSREQHARGVERIRAWITEGDCYQVNLTHRVVVPVQGDPGAWYDHLVRTHPAPFAAYLPLGPDRAIACISPERFLRMEGDLVWTEPIKGTRPRFPDVQEDARAASELSASDKDRAEHVMIVDLERNDLGRVARSGSVRVSEPFRLQANPTVWHLVTRVEARLRPEVRVRDVLRATFPGGSITGAPKLRAMQRIAELEGRARGVYTGAIGYFGRGGQVDLNVAIRTAIWTGDHLHVQIGGGIVIDSEPGAEWQETADKAWGTLRSLGLERSCWPG